MYNKVRVKKKVRISEIDFFRGVSILLMVMDHLIMALSDVYIRRWVMLNPTDQYISGILETVNHINHSPHLQRARFFFIATFCIITGISTSFSRNNFKRGIKLLIVAIGITIVTTIAKTPIYFGIIHMMAASILIYSVVEKISKNRIQKNTIILFLIISMILLKSILRYYISSLPYHIYFLIKPHVVLYEMADLTPLFEYAPIIFAGILLAQVIYKQKTTKIKLLSYKIFSPIRLAGRISLWIYVLHQLIIILILGTISYFKYAPGEFFMGI